MVMWVRVRRIREFLRLTTVTFVKGIAKIAKYRTRLRLRKQALPQ